MTTAALFLVVGSAGAFFIYLVYRAFNTGEAIYKPGHSRKRADAPIGYWINVGMLLFLAGICRSALAPAAWNLYWTGKIG